MAGQYIFVENPVSANPAKLEKQRIPPMSEFMRREGLALELPFERRPTDHKYPDKKVETLPIPLSGATFDPVQVHREKSVLETGEVSILNWLAKLAAAGFRVHDTASSAMAAQNAKRNAGTIRKLTARLSEHGHEKTGTDELMAYLTKTPRGANTQFDEATVTKVVTQYLALSKNDQTVPQAIVQQLLDEADGWTKDATTPVTPELRAEALLTALDRPVTVDALLSLTDNTIPETLEPFGIAKASISYSNADSSSDETAQAVSADNNLIETGLSRAAFGLGDPSDASAALTSAGPTYNGLSWLLNTGKGLGLWAHASANDIAEYFGAPLPVVQELQSDAKAILADYSGAFGKLQDLRAQIGGGISSFADRYFTRLADLAKTADQLSNLFSDVSFPESLLLEGSDRAFWGTGFSAQELQDTWSAVAEGLPDLAHQVAMLQGVADEPASPETLDAVDTGFDEVRMLFGRLRLVLNNIRVWNADVAAASAKGKLETAQLSAAALHAIHIPDMLVSAVGFKGWVSQEQDTELDESGSQKTVQPEPIDLPKVARRRTRSVDIKAHLSQRRQELADAIQQTSELTQKLSGDQRFVTRLLEAFREQDQRHYSNRGEEVSDRFLDIQSRRHFLDEWFRFWSSLSRPALDYAQAELVGLDLGYSDDPDNKDIGSSGWRHKAHQFMQQGKGCLWKSLFAKGKHKPYGMNSEQLLAVDMEAMAQRMTSWLTAQYEAQTYDTAFVDYHSLQAKLLEMVARVTNQDLTPADLQIEQWPLPVTFRPAEAARLEQSDVLSPRDIARIAGRLAVSIRDAASLLHRERHLDSATFKPVSALEALGYISKRLNKDGSDRQWCPPERLWVAETPAADLLRELMTDRKAVPVGELFDAIRDRIKRAGKDELWAARALLKELPHTWAVVTGLPGLSNGADLPLTDVLMISKDDIKSTPRRAAVYPMTLTPAWSNRMDECLVGTRVLMPGNLTFRYSYAASNDYQHTADRVEVHVPTSKVAATPEDKDASPYLDRLIGIDLGERGVGFSVRSVTEKGNPLVARGFVPVPAVRKLIKATRHFRKRHQKAMSVRTSHVNFEEMRKAVAGNVVSVIKYLMWHYKALPVLEMDLNNLDSGQRQLSHVYSAVTDTFLSRRVPTVDKARANTWRGNKIEHPSLDRVAIDPKTRATSVQPFRLFPGTGVRAANTSKECSGCGVNPIATIRAYDGNRIPLDEQGKVEIDGVTLQFFTVRSINQVVKGEGEPEPLANRILEKSQLVSHLVNNQLRVKPASEQSKDTSQSRYWCANANCEHHDPDHMLHADMNAGDNIVLRRCKTLVPKEVDS